jgi:hypothetical protein
MIKHTPETLLFRTRRETRDQRGNKVKATTKTLELTRGEAVILRDALRCYRKRIGDLHSELMALKGVKDALWKHYYAVDDLLTRVVGVTDENN